MNNENEFWKKSVARCEPLFIISVDPEGYIVTELLTHGVISEKQAIEINNEEDARDRAETLLHILFESQNENAFTVFCDALKRNYSWIVELMNALANNNGETSDVPEKVSEFGSPQLSTPNTSPSTSTITPPLKSRNVAGRSPRIRTRKTTGITQWISSQISRIKPRFTRRTSPHITSPISTPNSSQSVSHKAALISSQNSTHIVPGSSPKIDPQIIRQICIPRRGWDCAEATDTVTISIGELIGTGSYGVVYRAEHSDLGTVAYKKMKIQYMHECDVDSLRKEAVLHEKLTHTNIIKCLGVVLEPGHYGILFELAEYGELRNYLKKNNNLETKLSKIHDVILGIKYLHSIKPHPVIHGDLKIQNILVGKNFKAKICDFGFSQWNDYSQSRSAHDVRRGTSTHIPPEYWMDSKLRKTEKFDVYSFGICAWEIITLKRPFENADGNQGLIQNWVLHGQRPPVSIFPTAVPQHQINIITQCWNGNPRNRPSFTYIAKMFETSKL